MKSHLAAFAMTAVLVATIGMTPAFGQVQSPITVMTDKESYAAGESIMVSGQLRENYNLGVTVLLLAPNGNRIGAEQPDVAADRTFNATFTAGGSLMKQVGTYIIKAQHGGETRSAETTFEFTGGEIPGSEQPEGPITDNTIRVADANELITYDITSGRIVSVQPNIEGKSLILNIEGATEDGTLTLTIPRSVLDARTNEQTGDDIDFFVLVDGSEEEGIESGTTDTHRTLTIEFPAGSEEIEIIGTFVIPEFGVIAVMILAVAIISIIAVSSRSRLSLVPRY